MTLQIWVRSLEDYARQVVGKKCVGCGEPFAQPLIDHYNHDGGWIVYGFSRRQWLSVRCSHCHYDTSLWKLGIRGDVDNLPEKSSLQIDSETLGNRGSVGER